MPITHDDQVKILKHLLHGVLNIDSNDIDHAIVQCFTENDITNIDHFEGLDIADIDGLMYTKPDPTTKAPNIVFLPVGHQGNLLETKH